ncbi:ribosomal protein S18-alanine N-acetyltransferase [Oscillatoria sp. FACHB-1407]|uniref:ribosomal protein S18-alanine N-acetyltransferase n=1 Tax=Oscillatoria sp. FACHB-1407 TaxID=2692847 RepID=UPI001687D76F|nr:ribosomal protein S18-alanine N-acetyltransferase [Oscillatoria sp. FACHB-1407]MBD2465011.1 ribosomal protein S18-alanine N-acetyltransferase [Oscillatoria sp. FACHB-1407]
MNFLTLKPLTEDLLSAAIALDQQCFGGLWTIEGYQRELDSPFSDLLVLQRDSSSTSPTTPKIPEHYSSPLYPSNASPINSVTPCPPHSPLPTPHSPLLGLGCLWAILEEAHITILAIHPDYQRQGLGQFLLYRLLIAAWQRKLEWVTLEVRVSNQAAIALYQKFGFEIVGQRRNYYPDTGEDALILWRSGIQKPEFCEMLRIQYQEVCDRLLQSGWHLSKELTDLDFFKFPLDVNSPS